MSEYHGYFLTFGYELGKTVAKYHKSVGARLARSGFVVPTAYFRRISTSSDETTETGGVSGRPTGLYRCRREFDSMDADDVRREWAERTGEYSPEYYAYRGPNETSEAVRALLVEEVGRDAAVMEVGCSAGRHLAHLHEDGFRNLHGVEINAEAVEVMADAYPDLAADGTFHADALGDVLPAFDDGAFDAVYSVETLQHIHPDDDDVFDELARVAEDVLVTVENEEPSGSPDAADPDVTRIRGEVPLYHRDWRRIFARRGFVQVASESAGQDTFRAFRSGVRGRSRETPNETVD